MKKIVDYIFKNKYLILFLCCISASFLNIFTSWQKIANHNQILFLVGIIAVFIVYFIMFGIKKGLNDRKVLFLIIAIGFIFRLVYIQSTPYYVRQHDVLKNRTS